MQSTGHPRLAVKVGLGQTTRSRISFATSRQCIPAERAEPNIGGNCPPALWADPLWLNVYNRWGRRRGFVGDPENATDEAQDESDEEPSQSNQADNGKDQNQNAVCDVMLGNQIEHDSKNDYKDTANCLDSPEDDRSPAIQTEGLVLDVDSHRDESYSPQQNENAPDQRQYERRGGFL
jgi:hypothetical protein